jgi:GTPase SAR1 family protein
MDPGTGSVLVKVGVSVLQRTAPHGIAVVRSWLKGKEIMIVGQGRAGKTTFIDYLQYGIFDDEKETDKTPEIAGTARFNVKLGRDAALELIVKTVTDTPGQIGPLAHANEAFKRRPHAIIIFVDLTAPLVGDPPRAAAGWLKEFARRFETCWGAKGRKGNRLRSLIVVLNKVDKVDAKAVDKYRSVLRRIIEKELHDARGGMLDEAAIMPCVLVTNPNGTRAADSIIAHLAKQLIKK